MRTLITFMLLGVAFFAHATGSDDPYPVKDIPTELLADADAVIRSKEMVIEIISQNESVFRIRQVVTVMNKRADIFGMVYSSYDKMSKITGMTARVYDKYGKEISKLKKSDIRDESAISGFSLYEDDRVKYGDLTQNTYPYTVESEIEITNSYLYVLPSFKARGHENVSVQHTKYTVIAPDDLIPRYKELNFEGHRREEQRQNGYAITWEFENLPAMEKEVYGQSISSKSPIVKLAPTRFEYSGYPGSMASWEEYGNWIGKLNEGRNTLPQATVNKIDEMTRGMSPRKKVETIYKYMQNRTRYVSIQLGIGGLQPFKSGLVDEVGYGDCKALSFYTKSMLEAVGVPAVYTLVSAGKSHDTLYEDFPTDLFNHVILSVPMEKDTIWLECTSQTQPFNFLGSFTDDREVLMITENGAEIVRTPKYSKAVNQQIRVAHVDVKDGYSVADVKTHYTGLQTESGGLEYAINLGAKDQKDWVYNTTRIPHYELEGMTFTSGNEEVPYIDVELSLILPKFTSQSGKRVFFQPNLMNQTDNPLPKVENREDPISMSMGFIDVDSIVYTFPSNLRMEYLPEPVSIETEFGTYSTQMEFVQGKLIYVRRLEINGRSYSAEKYNELRNFFGQIAREDKKKVVLLKGT